MNAPTLDEQAILAPLARYHGERPPAPLWFQHAIEKRPERTFVEVEGAQIESLAWGDRGKPGLLFLHGAGAHADWWSFIAPFFEQDWRVCAFSLSGNGRSGWRDRYSLELYVREAVAVAEAAGLFEAGERPLVAAHSFGFAVGMSLAGTAGERLKGLAVLDSGVWPTSKPWRGPAHRTRPNRVYPTLEAALGRFRLAPPQPCPNPFLLDYIARESLTPAPLPDSEGNGWTWRFDPFVWNKMDFSGRPDQTEELRATPCPLAFVQGEHSMLMRGPMESHTRANAPPGTPWIVLPEAQHHLMLDQPLAVIAALRTLFATWP
jgi:pimeloyl-ACP methyl ester carboxylesterase